MLFTAGQMDILANQPCRFVHQLWVGVRQAVTSSAHDLVRVHDDQEVSRIRRVVDFGQRETEAYNVSLSVEGNLSAGMWEIEVANDDDYFTPGVSGSVWQNPTTSNIVPPELCYLLHGFHCVYPGGAFAMPCDDWMGRVVSVNGVSTGRPHADGAATPFRGRTVFIISEPFPSAVLREKITRDHGWETNTGYTLTIGSP